MIRIDNIRDELVFEENKKRYRSLTGGRNFEMGDAIRIKVAKADIHHRQLDFVLAE